MSAPPPSAKGSARGFTILEVMIAVVVMTFAIGTSIIAMQRAFLSLDTARKITIAGQIMQSEFEEMRLNSWAVINAYAVDEDTGSPTVTIDAAYTVNPIVGNNFTMTRRVTNLTATMKQITLTVTWKSYDGRFLSRSYTSYYGQNGLYDYFFNST